MTEENPTWINAIRARGLEDSLRLALDALEPLGPLAAQLLWMAQPVTRLFGWQEAVGDIARALEDPDGIAALRQQLERGQHGHDNSDI